MPFHEKKVKWNICSRRVEKLYHGMEKHEELRVGTGEEARPYHCTPTMYYDGFELAYYSHGRVMNTKL